MGNFEVRGKVSTKDGNPIPGVSIVVLGTSIRTYSGPNGDYLITIPTDSAVIRYTFIGYKPHSVKISESKVVDVKLREDDSFRSPDFSHQKSDKPISRKSNKFGITAIMSTDDISLEGNSVVGRRVVWRLRDYQVILPLDSLVAHLDSAGFRPDDVQFGLNFLKSNTKDATIALSNLFVEKVGEKPLNDISLKMIKSKSIIIHLRPFDGEKTHHAGGVVGRKQKALSPLLLERLTLSSERNRACYFFCYLHHLLTDRYYLRNIIH